MTTPAPQYVVACAAENMQTDGTCSVPVWLPYPQPIFPPLDLADGTLVAFAIVGVWVIGLKGRLVFRAARMGQFWKRAIPPTTSKELQMFNRNKLADLADKGASLARSTAAKVGAAGTALMASGAAFAGGGASSPGGAIAAELSGGKADVLLIIGAVAVILGVIVLWGYVKRAR